MDVLKRTDREQAVLSFLAVFAAGLLAFPPSACALEVGCFFTFIFVSTMFAIGVAATVVVKYMLSRKIWKLSFTRTVLITFLEVVLMVAVLIILQTIFFVRVLVYLPLAFLMNYALTTAKGPAPQQQQTLGRRTTMAALSSFVLPVAVELMAWMATVISNMITFKEISL
jgi:hypothetical protein